MKEKVYSPCFVKAALKKPCITSLYMPLFRNMGIKKSGVLMLPFIEVKEHRFYDFLFNFDPCNIPFLSVVEYFYLQEFLQHIKAFSSKVVNW